MYSKVNALVTTLQIFYDRIGNTLTVWLDDPHNEFESEETGDEFILMKDRNGKVIGFEKLNYAIADPDDMIVAFEAVPPPL